MNILFVNPSTSRYARAVSVPLGLLSIATYLQSLGHNVKIFDRTFSKISLDEIICKFKPQLAGISLLSYKGINDSLDVAKKLKKFDVPVVVGGPMASVISEKFLEHDSIDIVSIGEGEHTWSDLADYYDNPNGILNDISGIAYRDSDGTIKYTQDRPFINLAELPPLDWTLIDVPKYFQSSYGCKRMLYLYSAKGCPFSCTFCYNKDFHKSTYRKRPINVLLEEIKFLVENYGMDGVYFADEMWCRTRHEMHEICDSLKSLKLNFVWGCQTRIGVFDKEDFEYMYNSGCRWIFFGIESGSREMLEKINKQIAYDKIIKTFADCRMAQIATIGSFIIGLPGETCEHLRQTVNLIENMDTSLINMNFLALVPGSQMYKDMVSNEQYMQSVTLKEFGRQSPIDKIEYNYSKIPDIDLKVVRAYYMWRSFTAKDIPGTEKYSFAKKVISDALKSVKTGELISFIVSTYMAGIEFLKTLYYANFFPKIKKKYNIK